MNVFEVRWELLDDGIALLCISGYIDADSYEALVEGITAVLNYGASNICIDCTDVPYVNSSGCSLLTQAHLDCQERGGEVVVFGVQDKVMEVFTLLGLNQLWHFHSTKAEALASFS